MTKDLKLLPIINYWSCAALAIAFAAVASAADPLPQLLLPPGLAESQLCDINELSESVGHCEIFDAAGYSVVDFACLFSKGTVRPIPKLTHYKKLGCVAISDTGLAVGHAYAPEHEGDSPLQAIVFDARDATTVALPKLPETNATLATAISLDGNMIAGICSGRACVWYRRENSWTVHSLPQRSDGAASQHVCLSNDGKIAVAAQRVNRSPQLTQWTRNEQDDWQCSVRKESDASPHDVNNSATIVGSVTVNGAHLPETRGFVLTLNGEIELIEPLNGDTFTTARSINNDGVVVGWSDGVGDDSKWPRGFIWREGLQNPLELELFTPNPTQVYGINDRAEVVGLTERDNDSRAVGFVGSVEQTLINAKALAQ